MADRSREQRLLDDHPGLRERVSQMDDFIRWRATFSEIPIEGETFWVRPRTDENDLGDDRPKDHDQLIVEWINQFRPELLEEPDLPEKGGLIVALTRERIFLDAHPGLRELVEAEPDSLAWRAGFPTVNVDGEAFYVVGGDQLQDDDQVIVSWVNQFRPDLLEGPKNDPAEPR